MTVRFPHPITDTEEANAALQQLYEAAYDGKAVVARGRVRIPYIMEGFALTIHCLHPVPDEDIVDMGNKGRIYSASFLHRVADVAGVRVVRSHRTDRGDEQYLREFECVVTCQDLLMRQRQAIGRYELDLTDGSARATAAKKGLNGMREHINARAETGAFCRAIVEALAIPRSFKRDIIYDALVYVPSMEIHAGSAGPEVRQAMAMAAVNAQMGAFGPPQQYRAAPEPAPQPEKFTGQTEPQGYPSLPPDEQTPFPDNDAPVDDTAPEPPAPDPPANCSKEQIEELKRVGCYKQGMLKEMGWSGQGSVTVDVFQRAMAKYGGQTW